MIDAILNRWYKWSRRWKLVPWWPSDTRSMCQQSLIRMLAVAMSQRLDISRIVGNLAQEHRGFYRWRLLRLSKRLGEGSSLIEALEQTPDVLTQDAVLMIRVATQNGTLAQTLARMAQQHDEPRNRRQAHLRQILIYGSIIAVVMTPILLLILISLVPMLLVMVSEVADPDGDFVIPASLHLLNNVSAFVSGASLWLGIAFVLAVVLVFSPFARMVRRTVSRSFPSANAMGRNAELLRMLADSVDAGRPLPAAVSTLARYHFDPRIRQRLLLVRNEVEQGAELWDSLAEARLITSAEASAITRLNSKSASGWMLRRLAQWKREQFDRRCDKWLSLVHPVLIILVASLVVLVCIGFFEFLIQLTQFVSKPHFQL
ncbi:type IV pilus assembly protein [Rhodopirellula maiorica SM1]|uniref:Type IV pilus assembly protein n=1 Tax=Rhodopirellula maiorica SM1 TaxID=1265738 RepID=M5RRS1_9BACT|nr:type II secretion system F family protein [Rhodopirellula maiorica]EMI21896.1 type IV pilus assembly protein [Rhodopirellula maiorica SM1]